MYGLAIVRLHIQEPYILLLFTPGLLPCSADLQFILGPGTKQVDGKHLVE